MKNKPLTLQAAFDIQAAKNEEGKEPKLPTFTMKAYDGELMNVAYWGPVVIDLAGMKTADIVNVYYNHDTKNPEALMGETRKVTVADSLSATGIITANPEDSKIAKLMLGHAKNGKRFQASVGPSVIKWREVAEGESLEVNGKTHQGPFAYIMESELTEISIVPLGADSDTETAIAAEHNALKAHKPQEENMTKKPEDMTAEDIRAAAVAEQNRILTVQAAAKDHPEIATQAVEAGWDEGKTKMAVMEAKNKALEAKIEADRIAAERPNQGQFTIGAGAAPKVSARTLEAAVAIRAGMKQPEKRFDSETLNAAADLRIHSITDLVNASLAIEGKRLDCSRHDTRGFLQAAFSTRNIANVLSNLANKFIMAGYGEIEQAWREIANIRSVVDFKTNTGNRLIMSNLLKSLAAGGEIEHGKLSDETRTIKADTKALMLGVTRQDIINDDLNALTEIPFKLGQAAAMTLNQDFWTEFESDTNTRFTTSGDIINRQTGGALSMANLTTAQTLFRKMKNSDGHPLGVKPSVLLVSAVNEVTAEALFNSELLITGENATAPGGNVFRNKYKPVVSAYIADAPWYLAAKPSIVPAMEVAFLNGREEPFVETADADFSTLGVQMRCYYDYGIAFAERRGIVRSNS